MSDRDDRNGRDEKPLAALPEEATHGPDRRHLMRAVRELRARLSADDLTPQDDLEGIPAARRKCLCEAVEANWRRLAGAATDEPFPWDEGDVILTYRRVLLGWWDEEEGQGGEEGV